MSTEYDPEWELPEQLVHEAVRFGMETSFRDPILEAVADAGAIDRRKPSTGDDHSSEGADSSRAGTVLQGLAVFVVMFVVLYVALRKLTAESGE